MNEIARAPQLRTVISTEQIQKRVREMGRQISDDYRGQSIHLLALLENGFIFMADLARALEVPVICQFIKPKYQLHEEDGSGGVLEIFFSHEPDIRGQNLLVVEGLVHSGITTEFLMSDLKARGAASVNWPRFSTGNRPAGSSCSPTISAFWWMRPSWWVTDWVRPSKPTGICPLSARQADADPVT